jgi:predicted transcriptional regulator
MNSNDEIISRNDIAILNELIKSKKFLCMGKLCQNIGKQNKILKPKIDNLEKLKLISLKNKGRKKEIKINPVNLEFIKKLVSICN